MENRKWKMKQGETTLGVLCSFSIFYFPFSISLAVGLAMGQERGQEPRESPAARRGRLEKCSYTSRIDGAAIEYALWYPPDYDPSQPWPLIVFLHGSGEGGRWDAPTKPEAGIPVKTARPDLPFLVVSPLMRGTWSINGLAELDVLDTIADVQSRAHVDADRMHLTGLSLGAFAGWAIAAHHPDWFASLSVFTGGGRPELVGNLRHVPTWVVHGTADNLVPVKEAQRMVQAMQVAELNVRYTELPGIGHACWGQAYGGNTLYEWMAGAARVREPRRITYRTLTLRHHQAYWATLESMMDPARPAALDVFVPQGGEVYVHTDNVARLVLRPPPSVVPVGTTPTFFVENRPVQAEKLEGGWALNLAESGAGPLCKRHGLSGPIQDVFWEPFVIVTPAHEDPVVNEVWQQVARRAFKWTETLTFQNFKFITAAQVTPEVIASSNLICIGNPETHGLLAQVADQLPVVFTREGVRVHGQPACEQLAALVMIYPNPLNPDRYLVVCSGVPQAVAVLAAAALQPPFLSPTPLEDLVVITRDGDLLLRPAPPGSDPAAPTLGEGKRENAEAPDATSGPSQAEEMAPEIPPRGAVFDRNWELTAGVVERLMQAGR